MSSTHDIAIYIPFAAKHYSRSGPDGGGAELQTVILARELVARGLRVAHIVFPVEDPVTNAATPTLVERGPHRGDLRWVGRLAEAASIWRSMGAAKARLYVFRTGPSHLFVAALFCLVHRRKLVYAGAHDFDFTLEHRHTRGRLTRLLFRAAVRRVDAVVTQTDQQRELAIRQLPQGKPVSTIPSFVEAAEEREGEPEGFLWIGRLAPYKQPDEYLELAAALPDQRFRMVYFADSTAPPGVPEALEERARPLANLEMLGQLPRSRVMSLIERSYALVSTSSFEGMPNVFLEAWARGVPVAALTCDPGARIAQHELGRVAGGSRERLAQIVSELSHDGALRDELGANARAFVHRTHEAKMVAGRWSALFDSLLANGL